MRPPRATLVFSIPGLTEWVKPLSPNSSSGPKPRRSSLSSIDMLDLPFKSQSETLRLVWQRRSRIINETMGNSQMTGQSVQQSPEEERERNNYMDPGKSAQLKWFWEINQNSSSGLNGRSRQQGAETHKLPQFIAFFFGLRIPNISAWPQSPVCAAPQIRSPITGYMLRKFGISQRDRRDSVCWFPPVVGRSSQIGNGQFSSLFLFSLQHRQRQLIKNGFSLVERESGASSPSIVNVTVRQPADEQAWLQLPFPDSLISFVKQALNLAGWRPLGSHPLDKHWTRCLPPYLNAVSLCPIQAR